MDLFSPLHLSGLIQHAWDTYSIPRTFIRLLRHGWDRVDLFYPQDLYTPPTPWLGYSGPILSPGPLYASYAMAGIQWTYSIPRTFIRLLRHGWDTVDLFYPQDLYTPPTPWLGYSGPILSPGPLYASYAMAGIQWTYSIPRTFIRLLRHGWDTVDLFYPQDLYTPPTPWLGYSGPILSPGPLYASYAMAGIQWTYSIPRTFIRLLCHGWDTVDLFYPKDLYTPPTPWLGYSGPILSPGPLYASYAMAGIQWTYSIPRTFIRLLRHGWDTVDLFYPQDLYTPPTPWLGYSGPILSPGPLYASYAMAGIQWTYSIPRTFIRLLRHGWDTVDLFYPQDLYTPPTPWLGYSGPILSQGPLYASYAMAGIQWTYSIPRTFIRLLRHGWDTVDLFYPQDLYTPPTPWLGYSGPILSPGPLYASYAMAGIQWTYSIPRTFIRLLHHGWDTVDLFYPPQYLSMSTHTTCLGTTCPI